MRDGRPPDEPTELSAATREATVTAVGMILAAMGEPAALGHDLRVAPRRLGTRRLPRHGVNRGAESRTSP